jgi:hypothetical protein
MTKPILPVIDSVGILPHVEGLLAGEGEWEQWWNKAPAIHLAIFIEPYLRMALDGRKTIESRSYAARQIPYQRAQQGDLVILKRSSGPTIGLFRAGCVEHMELTADTWTYVRSLSARIGVQDRYWDARRNRRYVSLLHVEQVITIPAFRIRKNDQRAWMILRDSKAALRHDRRRRGYR